MTSFAPTSLPSPPAQCNVPAFSRSKDWKLPPLVLPPIPAQPFVATPSPSPPLFDVGSPPHPTVDRKGSIASILNSGPELRLLDEEESRCGYQGHFTNDVLDSRRQCHANSPFLSVPATLCQKPSVPAASPPRALAMPTVAKNKKKKKILSRKGLRHFSKQVCNKVAERGTTTYTQVADELASEIHRHHPAGEDDQKNIRRRVYDALNVLMAMGIIAKDKKQIKWLGLPNCFKQQQQQPELDEHEDEAAVVRQMQREERRQADLVRSITHARRSTRDALQRHLRVQKLIWHNRHARTRTARDPVVHLPFYVIGCPADGPRTRTPRIDRAPDDARTTVATFHATTCGGTQHHPAYPDHHVLQRLPHLNTFTPEQISAWLPDPSWHGYLHEPCTS